MDVLKKINHRIFWPISLISTLGFCLFARNETEIFAILFVYIATLLALFFLMFILYSVIFNQEARANRKIDKGKMFLYLLLHVLFLFGSIGIGVHFMGNRIILAVLNYVIQIFVLGIGLRKNLK